MLPSNIIHFFNVVSGLPDIYVDNPGMFIAEEARLVARLAALVFALSAGFLVWLTGSQSGAKLERRIETALFLEGTYFVLLFPTGLWSLSYGLNFIGVAYLLQAVSGGTVLILLSFRVRGSAENVAGVLKWVGVAAVGYITALWCNVVFQWFDKIALIGSSFLLLGATSWGFLVSLITMTLAVFFAGVGAWLLNQNQGESVRWFGLALAMIGVHYIVYIGYSFTVGDVDSAVKLDVWALPFLGLGISMLRAKTSKFLLEPKQPPATNGDSQNAGDLPNSEEAEAEKDSIHAV